MLQAVALMRALLGSGTSDALARATLDAALLAETDPLHWCATHLDVSEAEIMARAAAWAGLTYFDVVPRQSQLVLDPGRLEMLGETRLYRLQMLDRQVAFAAPDFFGVLRLANAVLQRPQLARNTCLVPKSALRDFLVQHAAAALTDGARQNMARHWPHAAAQLELTGPARYGFASALALLTILLLLAPLTGEATLIPLWLIFVMAPTLLRLAALLQVAPNETVPIAPPDEDGDLPVYSVLVPLRDEANMVDQLVRTLGSFDYPREKLDIVFVVESRSPATIDALRPHLCDPRFSLRVVPDSPPRTKPKALDFALPLCRGEFIVVYDAEDRPEPSQLRHIVAQFRAQPDIHCIQALLVIDNGLAGPLPAIFAGEYAGLFSVLLPALARWRMVMPLGGTSNHFRLETLRALGGWDAFNVTEDADLGVRLARRKLRCATSRSRTYEVAPVVLPLWLGQRTRWMKGWMQTYAVHNRRTAHLLADLGWPGFFGLQIVLLGMLLAPLLHGGFLVLLPILHLTGQMSWSGFGPWPLACWTVLVLGSLAAIATNILGLIRAGQPRLIGWQALMPVYWLLIALATVLALLEFVRRPFHWFKSPHQVSGVAPVMSGVLAMPPADMGSERPLQPAGNKVQRRGRKPIWERSTAG
ncbi:glycosyltransferase [Devosia sp. XK-2]|uniref:glycosyltransferase family 2 protein n=1 Tax=Devosia sp. XK-2 TaxID=3126689 RepID=UPI0030CC220A